VYSHFGESLTGLITIRAYGKQQEFSTTHENAIDVMNRAYFITIVNQRWLGVRLDFVGYILIFIVSTLTVTQRFSVAPAVAGLILSYCVQVVGNMGQTTRQFAELENNMNSTERVHHYAQGIESEAPFEIPERKPALTWPEKGEIVMKDVYLNYRPNLPFVLKGLSIHITGGERIGIGMKPRDWTDRIQLDGQAPESPPFWSRYSGLLN
jgi:ABC-type multidrug transport system fused ATPase/permease subunit